MSSLKSKNSYSTKLERTCGSKGLGVRELLEFRLDSHIGLFRHESASGGPAKSVDIKPLAQATV